MLRRVWKPVAATVLVGTPAYFAYKYCTQPQTFELPVRVKGLNGRSETTTKKITLLPLKELEALVYENAIAETKTRPDGFTWRFTTANLASNNPIEDAHANQLVERDAEDPSAPGDYLFFTVMDGHGGTETSKLLSRILVKGVALELANLISNTTASPSSRTTNKFTSFFRMSPSRTTLDSDPTRVSQAIEQAFEKIDQELLATPLRILANSMDPEDFKQKTIPDLSKHPLALTITRPAISGSCALLAVFDTAHRDLYVACTGDSRAVAGVWEPSEDGKGHWRIDVLTEDQTGRNPSELARMRSEHPKDEENDVIKEGRVLGGLEPTRAFGDARYKWPRMVQETLNEAFMVGNRMPMRPPPALLKTPPYVTARPVVTHRKISLPPNNTPESVGAKNFLVLATDGLWDELSNEEVVSLVAGHMAGLKGTISNSELQDVVPTVKGSLGVDGKRQSSDRHTRSEGSWSFKDENLSVHLIRNAIGGGDEMAFRRSLSIPAPYSRRHRDDITVTVVCWEHGKEAEAKVTTENVKAKL